MKQTTQAPAAPFSLVNPRGLYDPTPNGYSHLAWIAPGTQLIQLAGQGGENEAGELVPQFDGQLRQALANVRTALGAVGARMGDIVKLTVLVVDHTEHHLRVLGAELDAAWDGRPKPTCTLIPVPRLALDGMLVEVEALAARAA